jgi:hypothetical protein
MGETIEEYRRASIQRRLLNFVTYEPNSGCWLWTGGVDKKGYGYFNLSGESTRAHRAAWILAHGPIPDGKMVLHHCDVPGCVNYESHLYIGTALDNFRDMDKRGRKAPHITPWLNLDTPNPNASLTAQQVTSIRREYESGDTSQAMIARKYGVGSSQISNIILRRCWRNCP